MPEVLADLQARLEAAATVARDADKAAKLAHQARNAIIVEAVDEGVPQTTVADWAGFKRPGRITAILANFHAVEDEEDEAA